jgi:hypothetical protein
LVKPSGVSAQREADLEAGLPSVQVPDIGERSFNVLLAGIGGSGVLTVGALLGAAALVDRKVSSVLDFTGLAQKNGAVLSQVRLVRWWCRWPLKDLSRGQGTSELDQAKESGRRDQGSRRPADRRPQARPAPS